VSKASSVKPASQFVGDLMPIQATKTRASAEAWSNKPHFYKRLPKEFRRGGFNYRQIARENDAAVYEQRCLGCLYPAVCFEVIRVKRRQGFEINGRFIEAAEVYPSSEVWGADGFTFTNRDESWAKLGEISPGKRERR